jgi:hypothetical protein
MLYHVWQRAADAKQHCDKSAACESLLRGGQPQTWASRRAICAIRRLFCAWMRCISSAIRRRSSCADAGLHL